MTQNGRVSDDLHPEFAPSDPERERSARRFASLQRIADRHAATASARSRQIHPDSLAPHEAVRLVAYLAGGLLPADAEEPPIDATDLVAALTLLPVVRAELDELEVGLLAACRGRGLTWAQIAFALGLRSGQAAQQRADRLAARTPAEEQSSTGG